MASSLVLLALVIFCTREAMSARSVVCEHGIMRLECGTGKTIRIVDASYGRHTGSAVCPGPIRTTNCHAGSSASKVRDACNWKQSCSISVNNGLFGDPCHGTLKYLNVNYICEKTTKACERSTLTIQCNGGKTIRIVDASYGRHAGYNVCPGPIRTTNCHAGSSTVKVQSACNYKTSCSVRATNNVFGDPCSGTFKYLDVNYICVS